MSQPQIRAALRQAPDGLTVDVAKFCKKCNCDTPRNARGQCKPCRAAFQRAWSAANPEKKKAMDKAYASANKEKLKSYKAEYHLKNLDKARGNYAAWRLKEANREKARVRAQEWHKANPERAKHSKRAWAAANTIKVRAIRSKWLKSNPEYNRAKEHQRRARKVRAGGIHTAQDVKNLLILQRHRCTACNTSLRPGYHIDHVMPLALGGGNGPDNIQLLCPPCNAKKHAKHPIDFMQERGFLL